jgi:hypothetical protein
MFSIFLTTRHLRVGAGIFRCGAGYSGRRWPRLRQFRGVASFDHPIGAQQEILSDPKVQHLCSLRLIANSNLLGAQQVCLRAYRPAGF